mmetsp:Transcript_96185/g.310565  ORF Transcript_96185/g.310565 Transcript_96185/m.310565 type:complete len:332 (-) Transcript_96185:644-1639(-)
MLSRAWTERRCCGPSSRCCWQGTAAAWRGSRWTPATPARSSGRTAVAAVSACPCSIACGRSPWTGASQSCQQATWLPLRSTRRRRRSAATRPISSARSSTACSSARPQAATPCLLRCFAALRTGSQPVGSSSATTCGLLSSASPRTWGGCSSTRSQTSSALWLGWASTTAPCWSQPWSGSRPSWEQRACRRAPPRLPQEGRTPLPGGRRMPWSWPNPRTPWRCTGLLQWLWRALRCLQRCRARPPRACCRRASGRGSVRWAQSCCRRSCAPGPRPLLPTLPAPPGRSSASANRKVQTNSWLRCRRLVVKPTGTIWRYFAAALLMQRVCCGR